MAGRDRRPHQDTAAQHARRAGDLRAGCSPLQRLRPDDDPRASRSRRGQGAGRRRRAGAAIGESAASVGIDRRYIAWTDEKGAPTIPGSAAISPSAARSSAHASARWSCMSRSRSGRIGRNNASKARAPIALEGALAPVKIDLDRQDGNLRRAQCLGRLRPLIAKRLG